MIILLGILIISPSLFASLEGSMDLNYKIVNFSGSEYSFKTLNPEETGFGIDNLNLKIFSKKNKFYLIGNGIGSSSPERSILFKGNIDNKFKLLANYYENIYYFNNPSFLNQKHTDKYILRKINLNGEYNFSREISFFINNSYGIKKGKSMRSYFLLGSLIEQKKDTNFDIREISLGGRFQKGSLFLELSQGYVLIENKIGKNYLYKIDEFSTPYLSNPDGNGRDKNDSSYPKTNLSFNFLKEKMRLSSNFSYYKGDLEGKTEDNIFFNFGEDAQLISSYNIISNYKNKFQNFSSNIDLSYEILPYLEFENYTDYEKEEFESNIFLDSLLVFTDPETNFTLEIPYELVDETKISVTRFFNETIMYFKAIQDLDLFISYDLNKRKIEEEEENSQTENTINLGFSLRKNFYEIEGSFKKGDFSSTYFKTEPLDFNGYRGKIKLGPFLNISLQFLLRNYKSDSIEGKFENNSKSIGLLFSKNNYFLNFFYQKDKISSYYPIDFGLEEVSIYNYEGKNYYFNFNFPLSDGFKLEGYYSSVKDDGDIYPFRYINSSIKTSSSEIFKNASPFFQIKYLSYESPKYIYLKTKGMIYVFGLNLKVGK